MNKRFKLLLFFITVCFSAVHLIKRLCKLFVLRFCSLISVLLTRGKQMIIRLPTLKVVVYPQDTTLPAQFYDRYTLQGSGKDESGHTYQLMINFDLSEDNQLVGIYKTDYTSQRGLARFKCLILPIKTIWLFIIFAPIICKMMFCK